MSQETGAEYLGVECLKDASRNFRSYKKLAQEALAQTVGLTE